MCVVGYSFCVWYSHSGLANAANVAFRIIFECVQDCCCCCRRCRQCRLHASRLHVFLAHSAFVIIIIMLARNAQPKTWNYHTYDVLKTYIIVSACVPPREKERERKRKHCQLIGALVSGLLCVTYMNLNVAHKRMFRRIIIIVSEQKFFNVQHASEIKPLTND